VVVVLEVDEKMKRLKEGRKAKSCERAIRGFFQFDRLLTNNRFPKLISLQRKPLKTFYEFAGRVGLSLHFITFVPTTTPTAEETLSN
jgi:hypothetical protein